MSDDIHKYPSQLADRFQVRMPDGLRDRIRSAAEVNNRSMNAEIIARLEASFEGSGEELRHLVDEQRALINEQAEQIKKALAIFDALKHVIVGPDGGPLMGPPPSSPEDAN